MLTPHLLLGQGALRPPSKKLEEDDAEFERYLNEGIQHGKWRRRDITDDAGLLADIDGAADDDRDEDELRLSAWERRQALKGADAAAARAEADAPVASRYRG